jgi:hypothetical protein
MSARAVQTLNRLVVTFGLLLAIVRCGHAQVGLPSAAVQVQNANCSLRWSFGKLYLRELTGNNDNPEVDVWARATGTALRSSWCGLFQWADQKACGLPVPNGAAGSYNWFLDLRRTYYIQNRRGTLDMVKLGHKCGFWNNKLGRIAHIGMVVREARPIRKGRAARGFRIRAGNTGTYGGRDGAGVHDYDYAASDIYAFANWLY